MATAVAARPSSRSASDVAAHFNVPALTLAKDFTLPLTIISETIAILGMRGSGKTNTATVYVEELLTNGQQCVIIDPTDAWWGLKSSKDGTRAGFPVVVLGGRHGDEVLNAGDGATIADFIVDERVSVVLSTRHFESRAQERRFVTDLCRRLYFRKGQQDAPTPLCIVFDEASRVVPQRVMGEDAQVVGAIQQLVRQGRSSGFGVVLIDQRAATVNKDVLTQVETLIVHRTKGPQDRKALLGWIEQHDASAAELPKDALSNAERFLQDVSTLKRGEAYVWSPGWLALFERVQMRERRTFDSSYTPTPGEKRVTPTKLAEIDLDALRQKLATSIEKARADDPTVLRARIAELEATSERVYSGRVLDNDGIRALRKEEYTRGYGDGQVAERAALHAKVDQLFSWSVSIERCVLDAASGVTRLREEALELLQMLGDPSTMQPLPSVEPPVARSTRAKHATRIPGRVDVVQQPSAIGVVDETPANGDLEQRICDAFVFFKQLGFEEPTRAQLAAYLQYHPRTPTFVAALKRMQERGALSIERGTLTPSSATLTRGQLPRTDVVRSLADVHRVWLIKLDGLARDVVAFITGRARRVHTRQAIADALGYHPRTPTLVNAFNKLAGLELVVLARGNVTPGPSLYPSKFD